MRGVRGRVLGAQNGADVQERIDDEAENPDQPGRDRQFNQGQAAPRWRMNFHMSEARIAVIDDE